MSATLTSWTIFNGPMDCPHHVVVRAFHVVGGGSVIPETNVRVFDTVDDARGYVQLRNPGAVRFDRDESDDPAIVETWM